MINSSATETAVHVQQRPHGDINRHTDTHTQTTDPLTYTGKHTDRQTPEHTHTHTGN